MRDYVIGALAGLMALAFILVLTPAHALEARVRMACTADYFRFCFSTSPGSPECTQCFRVAGPKLSATCRAAIRASAEFGSEYKSRARKYHAHR